MAVLTVGAALLALWVAVCLPKLTPQTKSSLVVALLGMLVTIAVAPTLVHLVGRPLGAFAAIFIVVLPACTYIFLASLWLLGYLSRLLRPY